MTNRRLSGRSLVSFKCLLLRGLVVAATVFYLPDTSAQRNGDNRYLLLWGDTWFASGPKLAQLAILSAESSGHILNIKTNLRFGMTSENATKYCFLKYKCNISDSDTDFSEVSLHRNLNEQKKKLCFRGAIAFEIESKSGFDNFGFQLIKSLEQGSKNYTFTPTFRDALTLQVVWKGFDGKILMESGRLYVWTMDAWLKIPILVHNATEILNALFSRGMIESGVDTAQSVQIISDNLVSLIKSAPPFLQPLINVGLALSPDHCQNLQFSRSAILTNNFYTKLDQWNLDLMRHAQLDVATGRLKLFSIGIMDVMKQRSTGDVTFCVILSLSGEREPYEVRRRVGRLSLPSTKEAGTPLVVRGAKCSLVGKKRRSVTLRSGMVRSHLACPIVCNSAIGSRQFEFYHNNQSLIAELSTGYPTKQWTTLANGIKIATGGHVIELPKKLSQKSHGGDYMCRAGGVSAHIQVHVVVPPQRLRYPPDRVLVAEGDSINLTCETEVSDQADTRISVNYKTKTQRNSQFSSILTKQTAFLPPTENNLNRFYGINTSASFKDANTFVCTVQSIQDGEPELPMYWMRARSHIVLVPEILPAAHVTASSASHCSWKHLCLIYSRIDWKFSIERRFLESVTSSGARFTGHFSLNGLALTRAFLIERGWQDALSIEYDNKNGQLILSVNVAAMKSTPNLLNLFKEQASKKSGSLTAVFNYHYPDIEVLGHIELVRYSRKVEYNGSDTICAEDPTCFYSTAFEDQLINSDRSESLKKMMVNFDLIAESVDPASFYRRLALLLSALVLGCGALIALGFWLRRRSRHQSVVSTRPQCRWETEPGNNFERQDAYDVVLFVDKPEPTAVIRNDFCRK